LLKETRCLQAEIVDGKRPYEIRILDDNVTKHYDGTARLGKKSND